MFSHKAATAAQNNLDSLLTDDEIPAFHQLLGHLNACPSLSQLARKYLASYKSDLREKIQNNGASTKVTLIPEFSEEQEELILAKACATFCYCLLNQCAQLGFTIYDTKRYWRSVQGNRVTLLIQKGPFYWIRQLIQGEYQGPEKDLQQTLDTLDKLECRNSRLVGHLVRSLNAFSEIKKLDTQLMPLVRQFLHSIQPLVMPSDNENRIRSSPSPTRHHSPIENSDQNEVGPNLMDGHEATARSRTAERRRNLLDLADKLDQYIHQATEYHVEHTQEVLYAYRMPGHFARHWVKYAAGSIAAIFTARYIYQHSNEVSLWISTTTDAATRFYHNNVEKPLLNMYSVIRYDTHQQLLDPVSLDSSVHSLQNMMTDYAMEHYRLSPEQIDHVRVQAQRGDLSLIMKEYEHEIKRPIRNVMFGDMARLMLVQLQKQKVDLERTLIAMDRLLRSNEINFELIALIPAVLVTLVMAYNVLTFQRVQDRQLFSHMQTLLLAIEKILNANNTRTREALSDESHGLVYLHTYRLRQLMQHKHHLLNVDAERYDFYDDLDEVDSEDLEIQQRLSTVQRMFRHYQFLTVKTKIDK